MGAQHTSLHIKYVRSIAQSSLCSRFTHASVPRQTFQEIVLNHRLYVLFMRTRTVARSVPMQPAVAELAETSEVGRRLRFGERRRIEGLQSVSRGCRWTAVGEAVGRLCRGSERDKERVQVLDTADMGGHQE